MWKFGAQMDEIPSKINRKPGTYKFRTIDDDTMRPRSALMPFSQIKREDIRWFWEPYIPLGRLTMLGGDPGAGKSFITTAIAAALSRGESLPGEPDGVRGPTVTLMLNAEDDPSDTLRPRLENLNADMTKIWISTEDIILDADGFETVREMVKDTGAKLLIIDPIVAFLGAKMNMNNANEVRHIMKGIARMAKRLDIAIVVVRHNRKAPAGAAAGKAIYAGNGSIDFTAATRSELAVTETKNGMKFMNHIKTNSGRKGPSIQYEIVSMPDGSGLFRWGDFVVTMNATGLSKRFMNEAEVQAWLFDLLRAHPDGVQAKEVFSLGKLKGYSQTKLEHVKKGVALSNRIGGEWVWTLDPETKIVVD
jgi:DNA repair protein RadA/Sms